MTIDLSKLVKLGVPLSLVTIIAGILLIHQAPGADHATQIIMDVLFAIIVLMVFAVIAVWRWFNERFDKAQSDADDCGRALRECIDARARFEERATAEERQRMAMEERLSKVEATINGGGVA